MRHSASGTPARASSAAAQPARQSIGESHGRSALDAVMKASDHTSLVLSSINQLGALFSAIAQVAEDGTIKQLAYVGQYLADDWEIMCDVDAKELEELIGRMGGAA